LKIGHPKDFWGGVMFAVLGFLFAIIAYGVRIGDIVLIPGYTMGVPARMGPAFFPFWLGAILFVLGVIVALIGLRRRGDGGELEKFHWRSNLYVLASIVVFGLLLKVTGVVVAGVILIIGASFASGEFKWREVILLAVGLSVFTAVVFIEGLKLPIPLCPDLESLQSFAVCRG
jgi:hypothetical protein